MGFRRKTWPWSRRRRCGPYPRGHGRRARGGARGRSGRSTPHSRSLRARLGPRLLACKLVLVLVRQRRALCGGEDLSALHRLVQLSPEPTSARGLRVRLPRHSSLSRHLLRCRPRRTTLRRLLRHDSLSRCDQPSPGRTLRHWWEHVPLADRPDLSRAPTRPPATANGLTRTGHPLGVPGQDVGSGEPG